MTTIKETRTRLNLTQPQMGRLMGMAQQRVSQIERGKRNETKQMVRHLELINAVDKDIIRKFIGE